MEKLGNITLHHGDCLEVLRSLPDKSFDLAIVDPPYFPVRSDAVSMGNDVAQQELTGWTITSPTNGTSRIQNTSGSWRGSAGITSSGAAITSTISLLPVVLSGINATNPPPSPIARLPLPICFLPSGSSPSCGMACVRESQ